MGEFIFSKYIAVEPRQNCPGEHSFGPAVRLYHLCTTLFREKTLIPLITKPINYLKDRLLKLSPTILHLSL